MWAILVALGCAIITVVLVYRARLATAQTQLATAGAASQAGAEHIAKLEALTRKKEADERARDYAEAARITDLAGAIEFLTASFVHSPGSGADAGSTVRGAKLAGKPPG